MNAVTRSKPRLFVLTMVLILFLSACKIPDSLASTVGNSEGTYRVDPLFEDYYSRLGGIDVLGPAITPLFWQEHLRLQYTETGLMAFDPLAVPNYYLEPLGIDLGYSDPFVENIGQPGNRYVAGHFVHDEFLPLYDLLGGKSVFGPPPNRSSP